MNRVNLIGRLTKDPEVRRASTGNNMCRFSLAVDRRNSKSEQQQADFINCIAFGKTAESLCQYQRKGSRIGVEGRIQTGSYTNQQGQKVYTTDVAVDYIDFLDSRKDQTGYQQGGYYQQNAYSGGYGSYNQKQQADPYNSGGYEVDPDDLPF